MNQNLIELYFDSNYEHFSKGNFYDEEGVCHTLAGELRLGMFTDVYSVYIESKEDSGNLLLQYYVGTDYVEFFETYFPQNTAMQIKAHNIGAVSLKIAFQHGTRLWELHPGECADVLDER